jgi:hypothetical protein
MGYVFRDVKWGRLHEKDQGYRRLVGLHGAYIGGAAHRCLVFTQASKGQGRTGYSLKRISLPFFLIKLCTLLDLLGILYIHVCVHHPLKLKTSDIIDKCYQAPRSSS